MPFPLNFSPINSLPPSPAQLVGSSLDLRNSRMLVGVISPDKKCRVAATTAVAQCTRLQAREIDAYPRNHEEVADLLERQFDAILIDLDSDQRQALELVEKLAAARSTIVMLFSSSSDPDRMLRGMRAGAREFLSVPFSQHALAKSLAWVAGHRQHSQPAKNTDGKLHVFFGSKGGVGVTTIACNFAAALAEESRASVLLLDLNLNLGDAGMNLGVEGHYSTADAIEHASELDAAMLMQLVVCHTSGLSILSAPAQLPPFRATRETIAKLLSVARREFDHVIVDAGKKVDLDQMSLFERSAVAYLITEVGIPELRNANRLISQFDRDAAPELQIVINRHQPRILGLSDEALNKALTRPVRWKVPNDYKATREMQRSGTAIVYQHSPIATIIRQMAQTASGTNGSARVRPASTFRLLWKSGASSAHQLAAAGSRRDSAA